MSRIAKEPIPIPEGIEVIIQGSQLSVKAAKGQQSLNIHPLVNMVLEEGCIQVSTVNDSREAKALSGTMRSLANNIIVGLNTGFEKKLILMGVGYRVKSQGNKLSMALGYSHPVTYQLPEAVKAELPSQTEIILTSANKQLLGQVAAEIRSLRKPEPYKGKGIRYAGELVRTKEVKK